MMIITTILAAVIAGITIEAGISAVKNKKQGNIKKASFCSRVTNFFTSLLNFNAHRFSNIL